jgi:outer membrane usher protein FimD/PapC
VSGVVVDKQNQPIPFANVVFKGSSEGIVTNEDGKFYLESAKTYVTLLISSVGFSEKK